MKTKKFGLLAIILAVTLLNLGATFNMNKASSDIGNTIATSINTAIAGGSIVIYSGTLNGASGSAPSGVLATLTIPASGSNTIAAAQGAGVTLTLGSISSVSPSANGTAATFRMLTSGSVCVFEGDVSTTSASLNLNSLTLQTTGTLAISSFVITVPGT